MTSNFLIIFIILTLTTTTTFAAVNFVATPATTTSTTSSTTQQHDEHGQLDEQYAARPPPPVLDGFSQIQYGVEACQTTISTSKSNDVIVLFTGAASSGPVFSVTGLQPAVASQSGPARNLNSSGTFIETLPNIMRYPRCP